MPSLEQSYPNKRVLITGATSGLGRALALEFAQRGWKIAVTDLDAAWIRETLHCTTGKDRTGWASGPISSVFRGPAAPMAITRGPITAARSQSQSRDQHG
jgi:NAD(P)-dependent dehydrogenase (short-subunit alcohol dehydrogenase family)